MMNLSHYLPVLAFRRFASVLTLLAILGLPSEAVLAQGDALDEVAVTSQLVQQSLLLDLEQVGTKLVAVGERGHVLISDDNAINWTQVSVPVRVTLTASYFVDEQHGWVVGHDGVILRTTDGGISWSKLLDGYQANELMLEHAQTLLAEVEDALATASEEQIEALEIKLESLIITTEDAESFRAEGASRPFLDVWFKNSMEGFVIGGFGLILRTTDGGENWTPWFDKIDNPDAFHLNAVNVVGEALYISAEAGALFRSDDYGESWIELSSPYDGSFFGVVETGQNAIIAYGLRGNAFFSQNRGDSWHSIDTGTDASLFGGTRLKDGSVMLVGAGGVQIRIDAAGRVQGSAQTSNKLLLSTAVSAGETGLIAVGLGGVQPIQLNSNLGVFP